MTPVDSQSTHQCSQWRELSKNSTDHEILYLISGSPDGIRETKIKTHMQDHFKYSFQGSIQPHLKNLEGEGLISKETTRSGAIIWHANQPRVIDIIQNELNVIKQRENELQDLLGFLKELYVD